MTTEEQDRLVLQQMQETMAQHGLTAQVEFFAEQIFTHPRDGWIIEHWANCDDMGVMQQRGSPPAPVQHTR